MATKKRSSSNRTNKTNRTRNNTAKAKREAKAREEAFRDEVILWGIIAVSLLLMISNLGIGGSVGGAVSSFFFGIFGLIAYVFPILLTVGSFFAVSNKKNGIAFVKLVAAILFAWFLSFFMELVMHGNASLSPIEAFWASYENRNGGGITGGVLTAVLVPAFGTVGCYIIDVIVLIVSLVLITEKSALNGMKKGGKKVYESAKENNERYQEYREAKLEERAARRMDRKVTGVSPDLTIEAPKGSEAQKGDVHEIKVDEAVIQTDVTEERHTKVSAIFPPEPSLASAASPSNKMQLPVVEEEPLAVNTLDTEPELEIHGDYIPKEMEDSVSSKASNNMTELHAAVEAIIDEAEGRQGSKEIEAPQEDIIPKRKPKVSEEEIQSGVDAIAAEIAEHTVEKEYLFPPIDLLKAAPAKKNGNSEMHLRETANKLQQTLKNFGVNVQVTDISCGPAVTRYEIQPEMGVKVSKIVNLADDIKLNLAAADIRIEAPIPGKAAVGIEVPNKENVMVSFRELIESKEFAESKSNISFAVGKDISGKIKVTDIAKMPHLLIAGATGSGKSVCINTIIMSILYKAKPQDVKLIMIDPKVVELSVYNGIPHLMIPVVTDPKKAAGALNWAVAEMTDRYNKFAECNVREINGYNAKVESIEVPEGQERPQKMPQIVIIVDELADLMMVASSDVEAAICRLAQLARAAGIHLVIATQRPSVNVITGLIKANMPSRIAFAVTSGIDSRTILDMNGAEKLLGKGDMLFNPQGVPKPIRVQGAFVSDNEVADVVNFLKENNHAVLYSADMQEKIDNMQTNNTTVTITDNDSSNDGNDAYFIEAAKIIVDKEKASIGMLQRYLKVGFNRAARIMDQLEEAGIVGPEEGTKPRRVLMSPEEFQQFIDENC